jgi:hypothetical protein
MIKSKELGNSRVDISKMVGGIAAYTYDKVGHKAHRDSESPHIYTRSTGTSGQMDVCPSGIPQEESREKQQPITRLSHGRLPYKSLGHGHDTQCCKGIMPGPSRVPPGHLPQTLTRASPTDTCPRASCPRRHRPAYARRLALRAPDSGNRASRCAPLCRYDSPLTWPAPPTGRPQSTPVGTTCPIHPLLQKRGSRARHSPTLGHLDIKT